MPVVGSMPYVNGSSSAMEMEGEIPGSAPPMMPHSTPPNAAASSMGEIRAFKEISSASIVPCSRSRTDGGPVTHKKRPTGHRLSVDLEVLARRDFGHAAARKLELQGDHSGIADHLEATLLQLRREIVDAVDLEPEVMDSGLVAEGPRLLAGGVAIVPDQRDVDVAVGHVA